MRARAGLGRRRRRRRHESPGSPRFVVKNVHCTFCLAYTTTVGRSARRVASPRASFSHARSLFRFCTVSLARAQNGAQKCTKVVRDAPAPLGRAIVSTFFFYFFTNRRRPVTKRSLSSLSLSSAVYVFIQTKRTSTNCSQRAYMYIPLATHKNYYTDFKTR